MKCNKWVPLKAKTVKKLIFNISLFFAPRRPNVASSLVKCNEWAPRSAMRRCCTSGSKASGGEGYKTGNKGRAGKTGKYQRKNGSTICTSVAKGHRKYERTQSWCCTMQIPLLYDANLGKAFPRCTALAPAPPASPCNSQTRMAQLFPRATRISCQRKTGFSPLLKFAFALCITCKHFDRTVSTLST